MKKRISHPILCCMVLLLTVFVAAGFYRGLRVTHLDYSNPKIPREFEGYKILQITDLHCAVFGKNQTKLIERISEEQPDLIVITGDMFDRKRWNYDSIEKLLAGIAELAPIYAVTGNNEYDDNDMYAILVKLYQKYGVRLLEDECVEITKDNSRIYLYGVYYRYYVLEKEFTLSGEKNQFNLLLYHDPGQFDKLRKMGFDLILAGHTHGGIIRLPIVGGLIGNDNGMFPQYDYGMYHEDDCDMYVSTGLGNIDIPRFYNRSELAVITLHNN